jgi:hypothetical protein
MYWLVVKIFFVQLNFEFTVKWAGDFCGLSAMQLLAQTKNG